VLKLGVDGGNLTRDRRGMGRFARSVLSAVRADGGIALELISPHRRDAGALEQEFGDVPVHGPRRANERGAYDVFWYPWNGVRFRTQAPNLVTVYDAFAFDDPSREPIARWREQAPIRRAARAATRFSTISHWSRERITKALGIPPERIAVIPLAPDPFFVPGEAGALPAGLDARAYVLLVGAGERRKNARTLVAACARALRAPDEILAVVGRLLPEDARFAKGLKVAILEIDADDATLRALYRRAAVVAVPSSAEGFGLVAVEAMACGAPVLAANAAALPEATGDAAELLPPSDVDAWARAIRRVIDDQSHALDLRARGLARFASADRTLPAHATLALLREIADGGT
jgi:glycosyltransferase involved in cell wall biosynthesis